MRYLIDTSSLISLSRYYLPFDDGVLLAIFRDKFIEGQLLYLDAVHEECLRSAKGIVHECLPFLNDKDFLNAHDFFIDTSSKLPYKQKEFNHFLHNDFINRKAAQSLSKSQIEAFCEDYYASADFRLILTAWNAKHLHTEEDCCIITEESPESNDGKLFRKIPKNCEIAGLPVMTLPNYMKKHGFKMNLL